MRMLNLARELNGPTLSISSPRSHPKTSVRVRKKLVAKLKALHEARWVSEDGRHAIVTSSFEDVERLTAFAIKHAGDVEVLEPVALRSEAARRARKVLELHT